MNILKKKIFYKGNKKYIKDSFHIVYGIDEKFIVPMGVSMTSIMLNNSKEDIVFHIISKDISESGLKILKNFSLKYNTRMYIYLINEDCFEDFPITSYITEAMYNRFLIPILLKDITDRVLYLDADIICLNSMVSLKEIDIKNFVVGVVEESNKYVVECQVDELRLKSNRYFNSGMLYINISKWLKENINDKICDIMKKEPELKFPDQDILNMILENDCKYIDKIYNYTFDVRFKSNRYMYEIPDNIIFLHYVGRFKPWQEWCMHPVREKYRNIAKQSLWKDIPWDKPVSYKDMKNMGKSYTIYRQRLKSIYWYFRYAVKKIEAKLKKGIFI